jgi:hypothetical protein
MVSWDSGFANARLITELSLMVPIVNTLAFLFTVLGEWWVERKVIGRGWFLSLLFPHGQWLIR